MSDDSKFNIIHSDLVPFSIIFMIWKRELAEHKYNLKVNYIKYLSALVKTKIYK